MYKTLKYIRLAAAVIFTLGFTALAVAPHFDRTPLGHWLAHLQIVPAIMTGAAFWVVFWVFVTLTFGRVYCSAVCPLGAVMDAAARAGRACRKEPARRYRYAPPLNALRIPVTVAVSLAFFAGFAVVLAVLDPSHLYNSIVRAVVRPGIIATGSVVAGWGVLALVGAIAAMRGRLFCNTICPVGGILAFLSRASVYNVDINPDKCIHCDRCVDVCKSQCIKMPDCTVDTSRCVMCLNCTAECPNDAITVRRGHHRLSWPMLRRIAPQGGAPASMSAQTSKQSFNPHKDETIS